MIAYFDCSSGISGDMTIGALVDAGVPIERLKKELSNLRIKGYSLNVKKVKRNGFRATKVDVIVIQSKRRTELRRFKDIKEIIDRSSLHPEIKQKGLLIFRRLFEAEARVHGRRYTNIHLHELGAVDCIVDIFGTLIGLDILGIETVYSSPLNLGSGTVKTEHGILPVPAPATLELLKNRPVYSSNIPFELTTPTGAVLISSLASKFGPIPDMKVSKIGIGAGSQNFKEQPNILRLLIGQTTGEIENITENIMVIETNIDDMNPQIYEYVMDKLFNAGALDVFLTQLIMKKNRPGIKLTVLCNEDKKEDLIEIILSETTTIGVRYYKAQRKILQRQIELLNTKFGRIKVKKTQLSKKVQKISPEYEDCKRIAKKFNIPLFEVMKAINR
jgi:hypothetical protein